MRALWLSFVLGTFLLVASCADDGSSSQPTVLFALPSEDEPTYGELPFPGDPWLDASGHIGALPGIEAVTPTGAAGVRPLLATLDGFSTRPAVEVFVSAPIDPRRCPPRRARLAPPCTWWTTAVRRGLSTGAGTRAACAWSGRRGRATRSRLEVASPWW
jgi:hypothetical protein